MISFFYSYLQIIKPYDYVAVYGGEYSSPYYYYLCWHGDVWMPPLAMGLYIRAALCDCVVPWETSHTPTMADRSRITLLAAAMISTNCVACQTVIISPPAELEEVMFLLAGILRRLWMYLGEIMRQGTVVI